MIERNKIKRLWKIILIKTWFDSFSVFYLNKFKIIIIDKFFDSLLIFGKFLICVSIFLFEI